MVERPHFDQAARPIRVWCCCRACWGLPVRQKTLTYSAHRRAKWPDPARSVESSPGIVPAASVGLRSTILDLRLPTSAPELRVMYQKRIEGRLHEGKWWSQSSAHVLQLQLPKTRRGSFVSEGTPVGSSCSRSMEANISPAALGEQYQSCTTICWSASCLVAGAGCHVGAMMSNPRAAVPLDTIWQGVCGR